MKLESFSRKVFGETMPYAIIYIYVYFYLLRFYKNDIIFI